MNDSVWLRICRAILRVNRSDVIGLVEGERRGQFSGWAFDQRNPYRRLLIEVTTESNRWIVEADRYRADVHQRQPGNDGYCGFSLPMSRVESARLVRVMCMAPRHVLPSLARIDSVSGGRLYRFGECLVHLDTDVLESGVSGWVRNVVSPDWRATVTLNRDGSPLLSRAATFYREDSRQADDDGFHGFSFPPVARPHGTWFLAEAATGISLPLRPRSST